MWVTPLRFLVDRRIRDGSQQLDALAIRLNHVGGDLRTGRRVHEGHKLIGEAGHRTSDTNTADVRTATDSGHPAPLRHVTVHHWSPASDLHDAFRRAIIIRKIALLVVPGAIATVMHSCAEQPRGT